MKSFGDLHPFVQAYVKTVIEKMTSPPLTPREIPFITFTTPQFFNRYVMCWFGTSETVFLAYDGSLLHGETEIVNGESRFPTGLFLPPCDGPCLYMVCSGDHLFFSGSKYKIVMF